MKEWLRSSRASVVAAGAIVLAVATFLRFRGLLDESYWLDELYSADFSRPDRSPAEVIGISVRDIHPPLYQLLLWAWYHMFGYTEYAGRLFSAIVGVLCIAVYYLLGRDLFSRGTGLAAAVIAALNLGLVQYSQETRSYELLVLLAGLSWWLLYRMLDRRGRGDLAGYLVATVLLIHTHYYSFFFVVAQIPYFAFKWFADRAARRHIFTCAAAATVAFSMAAAPLVPYVVERTNWPGFASLPEPTIGVIWEHMRSHFGATPLLLLFAPVLVAIEAAFSRKTSSKDREALLLLLMWLALGYLLPFLKSVMSTPAMNARYSLPQITPLVLLASYGFGAIAARFKVAAIAGGLIFVGTSVYLLRADYFWTSTKDDFRQVILDLDAGGSIPIYERLPYNGFDGGTNHFQTYADLLGVDLVIRDDRQLEQDREGAELPECFWLIDAHLDGVNPPFAESTWASLPGFEALQTNSYRGAESVLMARSAEAERCAVFRLDARGTR